jgi:cell division protein FtsI/penicillin-binding protein 2
MSKSLRIVVGVLLAFVGLTVSHVWLNIGFDKFYFTAAKNAEQSFRVGFLPVT